MELRGHACTHVGRRVQNEDNYCVDPELGLFAVADGLGGRVGGEVASRLAVEALEEFFHLVSARRSMPELQKTVTGQIQQAFRIMSRRVAQHSVGALSEMATTMACLYTSGDEAVVAHVGDSRVYRLRRDAFRQLTRDHSLINEMAAASGEAITETLRATMGHVVTQTIGAGMSGRPDLRRVRLVAGDRYLICSDGLSDIVREHQLAAALSRDASAEEVCEDLVWSAYQAGGEDNITAIVLDVQ